MTIDDAHNELHAAGWSVGEYSIIEDDAVVCRTSSPKTPTAASANVDGSGTRCVPEPVPAGGQGCSQLAATACTSLISTKPLMLASPGKPGAPVCK